MANDRMTVMQAVQSVGDEDLLRQLAEVALAKLIFIFILSAMPAARFASVHLWGSSFRISRSACPQS